MNRFELKKTRRVRRKLSVRRSIKGTSAKPRLSIFRSLNNFFAQLIDDTTGATLASASTIDTEAKGMIKAEMSKSEKSKVVGSLIAKRAQAKDIKQVVFDRNGYNYHGRVKAFAESARENGLQF
ncbi:MAG: 50S ribosomal protein L18 [Ignavibacteria bacterium GWF2_33_9]|nr:MAG: 50S ribosomal protein L18 [Ignavibacteria bacterium GWF2_33_9]